MKVLVLPVLLLLSFWAKAQEVHPFYEGARALGMGGAQIAVVNDETALLVNPAALGKLRDLYVTILDPELELNSNAYSMYQASPFSNPMDPSQIISAVDASRSTYYHAKAQVFPSIVGHNFGFGIYGRQELDMQENAAGTSVNTYYTQDVAALLGFNLRLFSGRLKIGVVGKGIDRIQINNTAIPRSSTFTAAALASEGAGVGGDVGVILTGPWAWLPTLSAVARDVGGTQFTAGKNLMLTTTTIPTRLNQDYDVAVAIFPIISNRARSSLTAEMQQITAGSQSLDPARYYHVGYEYNLADILFVRAGMNGHFWTAGFELASEHFQFQATTYGEDIGTGTNVQEDRRYLAKISFRF